MMFDKQLLMHTLVNEGAVIHRDLKLSSGKQSNFYYDLRGMLLSHHGNLNYITEILVPEIVQKFGNDVSSVGGPEASSIPITTALICFCYANVNWPPWSGFYVRKEVKEYGLQKKIEGIIRSPCVIVDDVLTTGNSVSMAIDAVKAEGHEVKGVMTIIDREDDESKELKKKVKCYSLLKHSDFEKEK